MNTSTQNPTFSSSFPVCAIDSRVIRGIDRFLQRLWSREMLLIQRWSWREGEHWKWSVFFFHQIQNCYWFLPISINIYAFMINFFFLFSGKFLIFSCVYVFAVISEVQWVCLYWGLGEFDCFVVLWDWFGWIKDLLFYRFFYGHALFDCWKSPGKSSELWNWCLFLFFIFIILKFDLLLGTAWCMWTTGHVDF